MNIKKNLPILPIFILVILLVITGCGKKENANANSQNNMAFGKYETESIKLLNKLYDEEENIEFLNEVQGHITHIDNGGTAPVIVANNKFFSTDFGIYSQKIKFPNKPSSIIFFDSPEIGESVYYINKNKINLYEADKKTDNVVFENIDFNKDTDFIPEESWGSTLNIVRKNDNNYTVKYYEINNDTNKLEFHSQSVLNRVQTSYGDELIGDKLNVVISNKYGYCVYFITKNNEAYWINEAYVSVGKYSSVGGLRATSKTPYLTNVDKIYASADVGNNLSRPIYSKIGEQEVLYSYVPGSDILDSSDDLEISFQLPDGHKASEIKDIFQVSDYLVFVIDNNVYITDEIQAKSRNTYAMKKLEDISKLNNTGKIVDMAGASTLNNNIYVLMDDGKIYYQEIEF